jgi:hypothetical protein
MTDERTSTALLYCASARSAKTESDELSGRQRSLMYRQASGEQMAKVKVARPMS